MRFCHSKRTSDPCISNGVGKWLHVLCAELLPNVRFVKSNQILTLLLMSLRNDGIRMPPSVDIQNALITRAELFTIVPSMLAEVVTPLPLIPNQQCSLCNNPILGESIRCWYC